MYKRQEDHTANTTEQDIRLVYQMNDTVESFLVFREAIFTGTYKKLSLIHISSTSAVGGAVLSLAFGPDVFAQFQDGAAAEDKLSAEKDVLKNPEMLLSLIHIWQSVQSAK